MAYGLSKKPKPIIVGEDQSYLDCEMTDEQRSQHTHVIGATNTGKSRFLLSMIQQDIRAGKGVCVIDPHDELIDHLRDWLAKNETITKRRKVRILDLNDQDMSFGFNPLAVTDERQISATVDQAVNAMASVMGGEDLTQTPLLRMTLHAICIALASARLTLEEAQYLVNPNCPRERLAITATIKNPTWKRVWDNFNDMAANQPKMYMEYFQAAERRFIPFIADENVRSILGQNKQTLDLRKSMDDGEILLVSVSRVGGFVPAESSQIIARLLVNNLVAKSYTRPPRTSRHFNLYIDEAQTFLSGDIPEILSQCRKFGLHLTLAHQFLGQLKEAGDLIYSGIMGTARNKVVFSLDDPEDADIMSRRIFAGLTQYELPKKSMIKPTVVGHEIITLQSRSIGQSQGKSHSEAQAEAHTHSHATSVTESESQSATLSKTQGTAHSVTDTQSDSVSTSHSQSAGSNANSGSNSNQSSANNASIGLAAGSSKSAGDNFGMTMADSGAMSSSTGNTGGTAASLTSSTAMGQSAIASSGANSSSGVNASEISGGSTGSTTGRSVGTVQSSSETQSLGTTHGTSYGEIIGEGVTTSTGTSTGISEGTSQSEGYSQALRPIFRDLPTALYSLEEQKNMFSDKVMTLPNRNAFVVIAGEGMTQITTLDVPDIQVSKLKKERITATLKNNSDIHRPRADVTDEINQRMKTFVQESEDSVVPVIDPMNPDG